MVILQYETPSVKLAIYPDLPLSELESSNSRQAFVGFDNANRCGWFIWRIFCCTAVKCCGDVVLFICSSIRKEILRFQVLCDVWSLDVVGPLPTDSQRSRSALLISKGPINTFRKHWLSWRKASTIELRKPFAFYRFQKVMSLVLLRSRPDPRVRTTGTLPFR